MEHFGRGKGGEVLALLSPLALPLYTPLSHPCYSTSPLSPHASSNIPHQEITSPWEWGGRGQASSLAGRALPHVRVLRQSSGPQDRSVEHEGQNKPNQAKRGHLSRSSFAATRAPQHKLELVTLCARCSVQLYARKSPPSWQLKCNTSSQLVAVGRNFGGGTRRQPGKREKIRCQNQSRTCTNKSLPSSPNVVDRSGVDHTHLWTSLIAMSLSASPKAGGELL